MAHPRKSVGFAGLLALSAAASGLSLAGLSGCSSGLARRPATGPMVEGQGGSWELVFAGPAVGHQLASVDPASLPEYSRNDDRLNLQSAGPLLATNQWPQAEQPDLNFATTVFTGYGPGTIQYYDTPSGFYNRGYWNGWFIAPNSVGSWTR